MPKRLLQHDESKGGSEEGGGGDSKRRRGDQGGQEGTSGNEEGGDQMFEYRQASTSKDSNPVINVLISEGGEVQCPNCGQMQSRLRYHLTSKNLKTLCKSRNVVHNVEDFLRQIALFKEKKKIKNTTKRMKKISKKKEKKIEKMQKNTEKRTKKRLKNTEKSTR